MKNKTKMMSLDELLDKPLRELLHSGDNFSTESCKNIATNLHILGSNVRTMSNKLNELGEVVAALTAISKTLDNTGGAMPDAVNVTSDTSIIKDTDFCTMTDEEFLLLLSKLQEAKHHPLNRMLIDLRIIKKMSEAIASVERKMEKLAARIELTKEKSNEKMVALELKKKFAATIEVLKMRTSKIMDDFFVTRRKLLGAIYKLSSGLADLYPDGNTVLRGASLRNCAKSIILDLEATESNLSRVEKRGMEFKI